MFFTSPPPFECVTSISYWRIVSKFRSEKNVFLVQVLFALMNIKSGCCLASNLTISNIFFSTSAMMTFKYALLFVVLLQQFFCKYFLNTKETIRQSEKMWKQKHIFHPFLLSFFYCNILQLLRLNRGSLIFMNKFEKTFW